MKTLSTQLFICFKKSVIYRIKLNSLLKLVNKAFILLTLMILVPYGFSSAQIVNKVNQKSISFNSTEPELSYSASLNDDKTTGNNDYTKSQISVNEAREIAFNFFNEKYNDLILKSSANKLNIDSIKIINNLDGEPLNVYLCVNDNVSVIVGGSKTKPHIYGYSDNTFNKNTINHIPPALKILLKKYSEIEKEISKTTETIRLLKSIKSSSTVEPLLGDIAWNQGSIVSDTLDWNYYCPIDSTGTIKIHTIAGCTPVALGMIMKYHEFPISPVGRYTYELEPFGFMGIDFDTISYDYSKMHPAIPTYETARFLYHIGLACHARYTNSLNTDVKSSNALISTGVNIGTAIKTLYDNFRYNSTYYNVGYKNDSLTNLVKNDLLNGLPTILCVEDTSSNVNHSLVIDGYDESGLFHMNFGWGGTSNGYYELFNAYISSNEIWSGLSLVAGIKPVRNTQIPEDIEIETNRDSITFVWNKEVLRNDIVFKSNSDSTPIHYIRMSDTIAERFVSYESVKLEYLSIIASSINEYGYGANFKFMIALEENGKPDIENPLYSNTLDITPSKAKPQIISCSLDETIIPDSSNFYLIMMKNTDVLLFTDYHPLRNYLFNFSNQDNEWFTDHVKLTPIVNIKASQIVKKTYVNTESTEYNYNIYRKRQEDFSFKKIAAVENNSFSDTTAAVGVEYNYYITSIDKSTGEESLPSVSFDSRLLQDQNTIVGSILKTSIINIDGEQNTDEWDNVRYIELAEDGERSRKLYIKNDLDSIYFCLINNNRAYIDSYEAITLFHDNNKDGIWNNSRPFTEGAMRFYTHPYGEEADWFQVFDTNDYNDKEDYPKIVFSRTIDTLNSTCHEWSMPLSYFYPATVGDTIGIQLSIYPFFGMNYIFAGNNIHELTVPDFSKFFNLVLAKEDYEIPVAGFTANKTNGTIPLDIVFTDNSTGDISSWLWDFGDGTTCTEQNPIHTYTTAGTYTVLLTVTGDGGSDTETKTDLIIVSETILCPIAGFSCDTTSGFVPLTITFTDTSKNSVSSWLWNFGDGTTSTEQNPNHTYSSAGIYSVSLTTSGSGGADTIVMENLITATVQVGIENLKDDETIQIYPNPSKSSFNIKLQNHPSLTITYEVYNSAGQRVISATSQNNNWEIDMQGQHKGFYLVKIYLDDKVVSRKIFLY